MMMCVKMKRVCCARYVMEECGADPNVKSHCRNKTTALNLACYLGLPDVVTMLLHHGGDPSITNRQAAVVVAAIVNRNSVHAVGVE